MNHSIGEFRNLKLKICFRFHMKNWSWTTIFGINIFDWINPRNSWYKIRIHSRMGSSFIYLFMYGLNVNTVLMWRRLHAWVIRNSFDNSCRKLCWVATCLSFVLPLVGERISNKQFVICCCCCCCCCVCMHGAQSFNTTECPFLLETAFDATQCQYDNLMRFHRFFRSLFLAVFVCLSFRCRCFYCQDVDERHHSWIPFVHMLWAYLFSNATGNE